jgi:ATP-dependent helicase Lhr and Lhr-like helicase
MASAFDRLSPALQYQVVNGLGFASLRPVQELSIPPVLDGKSCVVLAPTAGGKTEAAFFPVLSRMDAEDWRPVSVIYVAPIRALLNNQEERVTRYCGLIGRRAAKWHGDTSSGERRAFLADPADVLLTTPESLEVMLMSASIPARRLFQHLRTVIIDEAHAFVGDDRGVHLSAVLERLTRVCGHDLQRIALSATVGNPEELLEWLCGGSRREREVVRAPGAASDPELTVDFVATHENAAKMIGELHPGKKRLVFVDSRRGVEQIGRNLRDRGIDVHVTHSSLSLDERRRAEQAFAEGKNCVIVATSALELGIDIGDLDHVLQVGCPSTVAAFLQRMGRSGRRPGTRANYTFLAVEPEQLVQAAALVRLFRHGFVEPVRTPSRAFHVLAHQIIALSIQEGGVPEGDWWGWVGTAKGFAGISPEDRTALLEHMIAEGILARDGGRLSLGVRGEKLYGFRNFTELYSVFSTPRILTVLHGTQEIGNIEASFVEQEEASRLTFTLAARIWRAVSLDLAHGIVRVEPAPDGRHARWHGRPIFLHRELCRAIRDVLVTDDVDPPWTRRAQARIAEERETHAFVRDADVALEPDAGGYRLWNFGGGRENNVLAHALETVLGEKVTSSNAYVGFREGAASSEVGIRQAIERIAGEHRPNEADALEYAAGLDKVRLSKFQPCLPPWLETRYLADQLALTNSPVPPNR